MIARLVCAGTVTLGAIAVAAPARAANPEDTVNACGCRQDSAGSCYCERKAKCGCPGECEPKGCEEKRAKQLEKEVELETKRAMEADRKHRPADTDEVPQPPRRVDSEPAAPAKRAERHMSAADRRALQHLLSAYVAEHPDAARQSLDEVRAALGDRAKH